VWLNLGPHQGLDPSARGLVSGERSPFKGVLRGEVARGDDPEGEGSGPRLSGLATGSGWARKSPWLQAMERSRAGLIKVPLGDGPLGRRALTRPGRRGRVKGNLFPGGTGAGGSNVCPHMRWAAGEAGCLRKWGLAPHSTRRVEAERPPLDLTPYLGEPRARCWATRKGRGCDAPAVRPESGVGGLVPSPAAGDRGKKEPDRRCPTGPALRPVNRHGVSVAGKPAPAGV
jgi:hypothetical protein